MRLNGVDDHLRQRHQQARNDAAEKQVADRGVRDQRIKHHRNRRRDDRSDDGRRGGDRGGIAHRVPVVARHHVDADAAGAGQIGDRRAGHAGEDDALRDIDVTEAALEAADQHVAEPQQVVRHLADVHQLGGEQEQRHREQHIAVVEAVQDLLGGRSHVQPGQQQVQDRGGDHRIADRQSEQAQPKDGVDTNREWAEETGHSADPAPSWISGARPRSAKYTNADVSHDDGQREHDVDGIQKVEPDAEIGGLLDFQERHVADHRRQCDAEQDDRRNACDHGQYAACSLAESAVENIEPNLIPFAQHKGCAPQDSPNPAQHADLVGPAQRIVEHVARDDLGHERQEHRHQKPCQNILGAAAQPASALDPNIAFHRCHPLLR